MSDPREATPANGSQAEPPPAPGQATADGAADAGLAATEAALLQTRRAQAGIASDAPTVGLALSGGGIRSATYCLGLLRGLAQRGQLARIDYLSTVSGGGYTGAMLGRLIALVGILRAQALLAANDSPVLAWLRRNGRYLTPSGSRDIGFAAVTYLRAFLSIHGEFIAVSLPFAVLVIAPHLWHTTSAPAFEVAAWQPWHVLWWPAAAALWIAAAPGLMTAYWIAREGTDPGARHTPVPWRDVAFVLVLVGVLALVWLAARPPLPGWGERLTASALVLIGVSSSAVGLVASHVSLALCRDPRALAVARLRNRVTFALRAVSLVALGGLVLGVLDLVSWWLLAELLTGQSWVWGGVGLGGAVVLVLRTMAQPLLALSQRTQPGSVKAFGPVLLNLAGLGGVTLLILAWLVVVQWLVFAPEPLPGFAMLSPGLRAALLLAIAGLWLLLTAGNAQMPNASSLHTFYRARLARAYLAVGNAARLLTQDAALAETAGLYDVTKVVPGDDTALASYQPEAQGGPIHLVNACLNQTRDDASGLYNADRKGTLVTATARGFELGAHRFLPLRADSDAGTLGRWVAVSGAAAAPGAGAYTSRGWALLLYFLGVRLGHWMQAPACAPLRGVRRWLWACVTKPTMLWSEGTATYFGAARPWWYLSDGGHFENTGVYALLKRRVDFIVLADCGADAAYEFADIENLVRKARIDIGIEIEFYTRQEAARLFTLASCDLTVLSPEHMGDTHSSRGVLLARVCYPAGSEGCAHEGTLLVLKPNLHDALDVDLLAYAQRRPTFPHESTGDQNFDEAQWESYYRLGQDLGRQLHEPWLRQLPGWTRRERHPLTVAARLRGAPLPGAAKADPWWRRSARSAALGASIGLGASGTLLLSLWQLQETVQSTRSREVSEVRQLFTETATVFSTIDGQCPKLTEHHSTQLQRLRNVLGSSVLTPLEHDGIDRLVRRVRDDECTATVTRASPAASEAGGGAGSGAACEGAALRTWDDLCRNLRKDEVAGGGGSMNYWRPPESTALTLVQWIERWRPGGTPPLVRESEPPQAGPDTAQPSSPVDPALGPQAALDKACRSLDGPVQLYIQVYDEPTRVEARALRRAWQAMDPMLLSVPSVENVVRTAALRDARPPVPWPQPTLLVHRGDSVQDLGCAAVLRDQVRRAWYPSAPTTGEVWVRKLPNDGGKPRERVIELWLPPKDAPRAQFW